MSTATDIGTLVTRSPDIGNGSSTMKLLDSAIAVPTARKRGQSL